MRKRKTDKDRALDHAFGNRLRFRRCSKFLTQTAVANIIGTSQLSISKWELGQTRPRPKAVAAFYAELGYTTTDMLQDWVEATKETAEKWKE